MSCSDPIADMLTSVRNAHMAGRPTAVLPHSKLKGEIARIMKKEGFVADFVVEGGKKKELTLYLRYTEEHEPVIQGLNRKSRPGLRQYVAADAVPRTLRGLGVSILSTSQGVMTDKEARQRHIGGEVLCSIW